MRQYQITYLLESNEEDTDIVGAFAEEMLEEFREHMIGDETIELTKVGVIDGRSSSA